MLVRRVAFFVALLFGFMATQVPEFVEQYRQRLGGAIDELAANVARFDSDSAQAGLTESGGIDRLRGNADRLVQQRGEQMQENVDRLQSLRELQQRLRNDGPITRLWTVATNYDARIARGTYSDFEPAVPTSLEGFILGLIGFIIGGGVIHTAGWPLRRRIRAARRAETVA